MPGYRAHLTGGLITALIITLFYIHVAKESPADLSLSIMVLCTLAGSLLPDIDTKSRGRQLGLGYIVILAFYAIAAQNYLFATCLGLIVMAALLGGHRKLFHSWIFWTGVVIVTFIALGSTCPSTTCYYCVALYLGIISHLLLDRCF